jgi:hypothetical protein
MRKIITAAVVGLSTTALALGLAGTAHAEQYEIDDPNDTSHGSDIVALQVRNSTQDIYVRTYHDDLREDPASGSGGAIFFDTDADDAGPEFVFVAGYFKGTDYVLLETEGFAARTWGEPVEQGDYILRVRYATERVLTRFSRAALGNPDAIRVAVRASGSNHETLDWVGKRRSFTPWIARG